MNLSIYFKMVVWEFILLTLVSTGLSYVLLQAFYAGDAVSGSFVPAVASVAMNAVLFYIASSRRIVRVGGAVFAVACVVAVVACGVASSVSPVSDEPGNYLIVALVIVVTNLFAFFLSRRRTETVVLLILSIFCCSWIQFYYQADMVAWSMVVLFSALALVVYKNYQRSARTASSAKKISFSMGAGTAALSVALAVGVGALVWFAVIAPLNPSVFKVELITEVRAYETLQVRGTSQDYQVPNTDMTSDQLNDQSRTVDDLQISDDGIPMPAQTKDDTSKSQSAEGTFNGIDVDSLRQAFDFQSDPSGASVRVVLWILLPLLLIVGYFVGRRLWRTRRLNKYMMLPPKERIAAIYSFVLERLGRIGHALPEGMTLREYCIHNKGTFEEYEQLAGCSFATVTNSYMQAAYGKAKPSGAEVADVAKFYNSFWKFARKQLGSFKYFFKSFRL